MFWVLESNLYNEAAFDSLVSAIERVGSKYSIVKRIPIFNILVDEDGNEVQLKIPEDDVFVCGSTGMGSIAKQNGWSPGYFDENLDYELIMRQYGKYCLNHRGAVTTMRDGVEVQDPKIKTITVAGKFFARPVSDKKSFAGTVFTVDDFNKWRDLILTMESESSEAENTLTTLKLDDKIVIAPLTTIYQEFRFFVVDQKIITGSMYKFGSKVCYSTDVPQRVSHFAQQMASTWSPNRAYCLDIAVVEEDDLGDLRVIEINALNSAGFYACDMNKFVGAINDMKFD